MAVRTLSAFIALPLFLAIVYFLPPICLSIAIALISLVSVYELLWRSKIVKCEYLMPIAYLSATACI